MGKNQNLFGKTLRCLIDRKEGDYYIGRSEYDSPDVDKKYVLMQRNIICVLGILLM
ncbi:MAG: hypothetical protein CM15mP32_0680 [Flavobacteriaceae bacterium]|nr:MAG: hypothetical protein CM15mP32_0680 [Flavobacteriaceae bacterium]